jgi:uncharacterized glyoxalase superfamily protein PhnB
MPKTLPPHCVPILRVRDAQASADYYHAALGFTKNWEHQLEPGAGRPWFISIQLGEATLFLSEHGEDGALRTHVYLYVDDVDSLYRECHAHGGRVIQPPQDTPWGMREMRVQDLDSNEIRLGSRLAPTTGQQDQGSP